MRPGAPPASGQEAGDRRQGGRIGGHRARRLATATACAIGSLAAQSRAADVTVTAMQRGGGAAADAVVVFDPLDATPPPAPAKAVIDQVNKRFVPHVSVLRTGTSVTLPNSDQIRHQVYSLSTAKTFNLKLYSGAPPTDVVFDRAGMVVLGCNIHDTMVAFVLVVDSPYFARIPAGGSAVVKMPPGRYRLRVWHEKLAAPVAPREIVVGADALPVALTLDIDPNRDEAAPWP